MARSSVAEAARLVTARHSGRPRTVIADRKGVGDFVTAVDIEAEERLRDRLLGAFPTDGFLGEESGAVRGTAEHLWIVDPIDGTSNFAQGLPHYAVSAACLFRGDPVVAAVHVMPDDVTLWATRGGGAFCAGRQLCIEPAALDDATVLGVQWHRGEFDAALLEPLLSCGARVRVFGSSVTQLCDVALGRLHANVQPQGRLWDIAAVALIVGESGGRFTDFQGRPLFPRPWPAEHSLDDGRHHPSIAGPEPLHGELVARLRALTR